jgi:phospholipid-binding lipoprotein MlaA
MHNAQQRIALVALLTLMMTAISGCASIPEAQRDARDPWQPYNRAMFRFNTDFDNAFLKPVAQGYQAVMPEPVNHGVTNFFNNVADITSAVNNGLQFKLSRAGTDVSRVAVNTTVGLVGFIDVATNLGIPSYKEDFGQTLGYWGFGDGPYFVMPILGPSSVRDTVGFAGDVFIDPFFSVKADEIYWGFVVLRAIDKRAGLLVAGDLMDQAALDPYVFVRDAYLQRRLNLVHDGNPPVDEEEDLFWGEDAIDQ